MGRRRRCWTKREEEVLIAALKKIVSEGWRCETGFRAGYLRLLECSMLKAFPKTDIKAEPHINSKLQVWKKYYASLTFMLGLNGITWNNTTKMIDVHDDVWNSYVKTDSNARTMRYKSWPFYSDWCEIFGKERVIRGDVRELDCYEIFGKERVIRGDDVQELEMDKRNEKEAVETNKGNMKEAVETNKGNEKEAVETNKGNEKEAVETNNEKEAVETNKGNEKEAVETNNEKEAVEMNKGYEKEAVETNKGNEKEAAGAEFGCVSEGEGDGDEHELSVCQPQSDEIAKKQAPKKRKMPECGTDPFVGADAINVLCDKLEARFEDIARRRIGLEHDVSNARRELYGALGRVPGLEVRDKLRVAKFLVNKTGDLDLFFSLPEEDRVEMVNMILAGQY